MTKSLLIAFATSVALAGYTSSPPAAGTVVADGSDCVGVSKAGEQLALSDAQTTAAQKPGWLVFTCSGKLPANVAPPRTTQVIYGADTGAPCRTTRGLTQDWREIIAVSGEVTLDCAHVRASGELVERP